MLPSHGASATLPHTTLTVELRGELMKTRLIWLLLCAGLLASPLASAQTVLSVQGRLASVSGGPVADGTYGMALALYDKAAGGGALYLEKFIAVNVQGGVFALTLGEDPNLKLDAGLFISGQAKFMGVQVGAEPELPRVALRAVPYALSASSAADLACSGCITADDIGVGAVKAQHVDFGYAGSAQKGGPATSALAAETAKFADAAKTADSAKFADGAKVADTAVTAEEASALKCTGCVTAKMVNASFAADLGLPAKTDFAAIAFTGAMKDAKGPLGGDLDFAGNQAKLFRFQNATEAPAVCDAKTIGLAWYNTATNQLLVCNGAEFVVFANAVPPVGTASNPAASCRAVLDDATGSKSGLFWLKHGNGAAYQGYCEMAAAGGGWTLALNLDTSDGHVMWWANPLWTNDIVKGTPGLGGGDVKTEAWNSYAGASEILVVVHEQGTVKGWKRWKKADAKTLFEVLQGGDNTLLGSAVIAADVTNVWDKERLVRISSQLFANHCVASGGACTSGNSGSPDGDRIGSNEGTPGDNDGGGLGNWHDMNHCCSGQSYGSGKVCNGAAFRTTSEAQAGWSYANQYGTFGTDSFGGITATENDTNCGKANWAKSSGVNYDYAIFLGGK